MIKVSIIIPCRNEEKFIGRCLQSLLEQDYPKENLEVLVIDGNSEDGTREIIRDFSSKHSFIKLLENLKKFTPFGLNIGIKNSRGEVIVRMDAHASYEKDYVSKCVKYLQEYNADNVGGVIKTLPAKNTLMAKAIANCLSHPFGAASDFRMGAAQPKETDTVFGGCYKREVFEKIGLFNENLLRSQDMEFNLRLKKAGGKILLAPDIVAYYYPQSNLFNFFKHNFEDGVWAILPLKFVKIPFKLRHYIPLIFVLTLPLSIWPYILISLFFSLQIAFRERDFRLFFIMPLTFFCRHFGYGLGSIWGLVKIIL
ncbi:MAG: glycosyltransferase family 2 protein [Patescibacteria group bacterium]|nr:glycosyltransferase family 2 protein [Patescibacteria group bacterium]